jgi:hypothetical protein
MFNYIERYGMEIPLGFLRLVFLCSASILLFEVPCATGGAIMDFDLDAYQWKNRIILIFAPSSDSDAFKRQMREFEGQGDGILDRDLIIFEIFKRGRSHSGNASISEHQANQLRHQFRVKEGKFMIILIGKDGGVKLRSNDPVATSGLFSLIDGMPMRQEEMRRKGEGQ